MFVRRYNLQLIINPACKNPLSTSARLLVPRCAPVFTVTFSRGLHHHATPASSRAGTLGASGIPFYRCTRSSAVWGNCSIRRAGSIRDFSINRGTSIAPNYQESSSSSPIVLFLIVLAVSGSLYIVQPSSTGPEQPKPPKPPAATSPSYTKFLLPGVVLDEDMASVSAPGRPGNLTATEDAKLKEMWTLMHRLFGVKDPNEPDTPPVRAPSVASAAPSAPVTEKKKSRFSLWGRKSEPEPQPVDTTASGGIDLTSTEANDKFGLSKDFKETLAKFSAEEIRTAFWDMTKHDHPDAVLLRFLRARKWDVNAALVMGVTSLRWRMDQIKLDTELMPGGEARELRMSKSADKNEQKDGEDFLNQYRMGKSYIHGIDAEDRPISWVRVRLHHGGEQGNAALERFVTHTIETARFLLRPPVDTATLCFDLTGFSLANMDYTPVKFMIKCFEANYPESLGLIIVHNAPYLFQGIWRIIRGWMDPVVASKVNFTSGVEGLSEFIPLARIPKELGGDEDWEWKYIEPTEEENALMADTATRDAILAKRKEMAQRFENATLRWVKGDEAAKAERTQVALEMKKNYWELDPYVRARSCYDAPRSGIINPGGLLNYYPGTHLDEKAEQTPAFANGNGALKLDQKVVAAETTPASGLVAS